jgi:hypothetical protein
MRKSRFAEDQIVAILLDQAAGDGEAHQGALAARAPRTRCARSRHPAPRRRSGDGGTQARRGRRDGGAPRSPLHPWVRVPGNPGPAAGFGLEAEAVMEARGPGPGAREKGPTVYRG